MIMAVLTTFVSLWLPDFAIYRKLLTTHDKDMTFCCSMFSRLRDTSRAVTRGVIARRTAIVTCVAAKRLYELLGDGYSVSAVEHCI